MIRLALLVGALGALGCASLPANPEHMSPEQIREWVKDRNASVLCAVVNTPYGRGYVLALGLDRGIVLNGTLVVDDACKVTIQSQTKPAGP